MRKILLFAFVGMMATTASAQSFLILDSDKNGYTDITGTEVTGNVIDGEKYTKFGYAVVNTTENAIDVGLKRTELSIVSGTNDYFCWFDCYSAVAAGSEPVFVAPDSVTMAAGDTNFNSFGAYFEYEEQVGISCYRYTFYDVKNPSDSASYEQCFEFRYVGVEEQENTITAQLYPNPANDVINLKYDLDSDAISGAQVIVTDLMGKQIDVRSVNGMSGNLQVDTRNFQNGIYLMNVISADGSKWTQKFSVIR